MPMVISPDSEMGKELAKWDAPKSQGGMRADGYERYPMMLYRAMQRDNGQVMCLDNPLRYRTEQEQLACEAFNRQCERKVWNDAEYDVAKGQGWHESQKDAVDAYEKEQQDIAELAAKRAYNDQRLSEKAQDEIKAVEQTTHEHVLDTVPLKKKPRGRPFVKKVLAAAVTRRGIEDPDDAS